MAAVVAEAVTVLIVDDEDDLAGSIEMLLALDGYRTARARDGVQALELLELLKPDVMLLDMNMPRLDGFGVLRALAERRPCPIVAMSSFPAFLPKAIELGASRTLPKPFELEALRAVVRQARDAVAVTSAAPAAEPTVGLFEDERVQRLQCLLVMEESTDACLDELVRTTAELLRTPMSLVSIITADRQWWKAMHGMPAALAQARGTPRSHSFCTHAVAARAPLVVSDAGAHPVFADNEMVKDGVLKAYAGVPLVMDGIGALGTLCVLDREARTFSATDLQLLGLLAERVVAEIEWRERWRKPDRPLGTFKYLSLLDEKHGIYNAPAFRSVVETLARLALLEEDTFGLVAFDWPNGGDPGSPSPSSEEAVGIMVQALRGIGGGHLILGRLEDRAVAAVLPHAKPETLRSVLSAALAEDRRLRAEHPAAAGVPATVAVGEILQGSLKVDLAFAAIRARLSAIEAR